MATSSWLSLSFRQRVLTTSRWARAVSSCRRTPVRDAVHADERGLALGELLCGRQVDLSRHARRRVSGGTLHGLTLRDRDSVAEQESEGCNRREAEDSLTPHSTLRRDARTIWRAVGGVNATIMPTSTGEPVLVSTVGCQVRCRRASARSRGSLDSGPWGGDRSKRETRPKASVQGPSPSKNATRDRAPRGSTSQSVGPGGWGPQGVWGASAPIVTD